jgi:tetratricopeptide (TPR) repeat protein
LVRRDAEDLAGRKQLAALLLAAGKTEEAARYARQALEIDVADPRAESYLGDALLAQRKYADAIEAFQTSLEIDDKVTETRLKLAEAYLQSGNRTKAENEVARVLASEPANPEAQRLKKVLEENPKSGIRNPNRGP